MKKIVFIFTLISGMIFFQSCTGPEGPRGPQGVPGIDGIDGFSEVFEIQDSFISGNDYTVNVPLNPAIRTDSNVLVYELSGTYNGNDIWSPLPRVYYVNGGDVRYFFDFTINDIQIYLDTNLNMIDVPDYLRINKVFRVVIVPGYFSLDGIDTSDINAVMGVLNLDNNSVQILD